MSKKIPKVFVNKIDKRINNNKEVFYSYIDKNQKPDIIKEEKIEKDSIMDKINSLFASLNFVYKLDVVITTKDGILNESIIAMTGNNLLTIEGKKINVEDIIDIKQKTT